MHEHQHEHKRRAWFAELVHRTLTAAELFFHAREPLPERIRMALRNTFRRVEHLGTCCGHYGEPGC